MTPPVARLVARFLVQIGAARTHCKIGKTQMAKKGVPNPQVNRDFPIFCDTFLARNRAVVRPPMTKHLINVPIDWIDSRRWRRVRCLPWIATRSFSSVKLSTLCFACLKTTGSSRKPGSNSTRCRRRSVGRHPPPRRRRFRESCQLRVPSWTLREIESRRGPIDDG